VTNDKIVEHETEPRTGIPAAELQERRERLLEHIRRDGLSGYVLFGADYIQYFTGFWFLSNERPVIYAESVGGESAVYVPEFEVERTHAEAAFARVESYPEYPGIEHPMSIFARVLADLGIRDAIGADQDGYPGLLGYKGPALSAAAGSHPPPARPPGTAARSGYGARGRTRSRTTSSFGRATCLSRRRARRSGATTPSSSGR
jgi:Xaa-Pro aminopeptidase